MTYKCTNCAHEQEEYQRFCPVCGDNMGKEELKEEKKEELEQKPEPKEEKKEELNLDLNNDGVVDEKDASIAGKALSRISRKLKKK